MPPLRLRLCLTAFCLSTLLAAPAQAGLLKQLLGVGLGTGVAVAAQHQYVHNTPRWVGSDIDRYNESQRRRAAVVQARAPSREQADRWGERSTMMCGPYVLYASFAAQLKGRTFEQFVAGLEQKGQWGQGPDYGMKPRQLVDALRDLGFGQGDAYGVEEPQVLDRLYDAVDAGKLVMATVDANDVWPQASIWDKLHGQGRPRQADDPQGEPHLVRVVSLQRDRQGRVAQVLLYDVNHPGSTLSVRQFEEVMASGKRAFHGDGNRQLVFITHKALERPAPVPAMPSAPAGPSRVAQPNFN